MSDPRDDLASLIEQAEFGYDTERRPPSAWGYSLADAIIAAGWREPVPHCDHDWSTDRSTYGGNPWRECNLCGKQEDL